MSALATALGEFLKSEHRQALAACYKFGELQLGRLGGAHDLDQQRRLFDHPVMISLVKSGLMTEFTIAREDRHNGLTAVELTDLGRSAVELLGLDQ